MLLKESRRNFHFGVEFFSSLKALRAGERGFVELQPKAF